MVCDGVGRHFFNPVKDLNLRSRPRQPDSHQREKGEGARAQRNVRMMKSMMFLAITLNLEFVDVQ